MIDVSAAQSGEDRLACRLATMSIHTSLTALEAALQLAREPHSRDSARRVATMARHIAGGAEQLAASIEASHHEGFVFIEAPRP